MAKSIYETVRPHQVVAFDYTNHEGERRQRRVVPLYLHFGSTEWHPEPQWLLAAIDVEKDERRDFAMAKVANWRSAKGGDSA